VIHEVWFHPDGTLKSEGEVFIANDEADVFAGFMAKKKQEVA
jgi:hypothetical protein